MSTRRAFERLIALTGLRERPINIAGGASGGRNVGVTSVVAQSDDDPGVRFEISPKSDRKVGGARLFLATHGGGDQQARFVIELDEGDIRGHRRFWLET